MHIVFVCAEFPYTQKPTGGFGTYVDNISQALVNLGCLVTIICQGEKNKILHQGRRTIWVITSFFHRFGVLEKNTRIPAIKSLVSFLNYPIGFSWSVAKTISQISKNNSIDIIEGGDFGAELFISLLFRKSSSQKFVIKLHTPSFLIRQYNDEPKSIFYQVMELLEDFCLKKADELYSPSRALAKLVSQQIKRKIESIIPYPVFKLKISTKVKRDPLMVLYVGKLQKKKGVFVLVDAIVKVVDKIPKAKFYFVGPDTAYYNKSIKKQLTDKLNQYGGYKNATFISSLPQSRLNKYYQKTALTVIPSLWENYPNVLLEAIVYGSAVVATNAGGIPEIVIHKKHALLVPPNDSSSLAEGIITLLRHQALKERMVKEAQRHLKERHSRKGIAEQTSAFYEQIVEAPRGG